MPHEGHGVEKMDSYLEDQRGAGELDSEGSFSIDPLAALRKTLASALPEPHYYLFQICQGLIAGGAREIGVALGRASTRFSFDDRQGLFSNLDPGGLSRGLALSSADPRDLLMTGMATAVGSEMDRVVLRTPGRAQALQITLEGADLIPVTPLDGPSSLELHRTEARGLSFAWTRIWGAREEEGELLQRYAFAPVDMTVGGLLTSPCARFPRFLGMSAATVLREAVVLGERAGHRVPSETGVEAPALLLSPEGEAMGEAPGEGARQWSLFRTDGDDPESRLVWIRHGQLFQVTREDLGLPGLLVLAPAEGLDVDASGYSLVVNEAYERRVEQARRLAAALA